MSKSSFIAEKYIRNAFSPQVAILCSEDADNVCLKNNLRFVDLIQPFIKLYPEAQICDPGGNHFRLANMKIMFEDMNRRPPQPVYGKKILSEAVLNAPWSQEININMKNGLELSFQPTTAWFEAWRELFLQIQYPSDHEFTKHYLACIIVISAGSETPMDQLNKLSQYQHQQQHQNAGGFPKWFCPNILKFYVLLHDVSEVEETKVEEIYQQMTSNCGAQNCHLLHINSRSTEQVDVPLLDPDPWTKYLKQKSFVDKALLTETPEARSGSETPHEDIIEFPSRVTEGENSDLSDMSQHHPLSPVSPMPEECEFKPPPEDVPLLKRQFLSEGDGRATQNHGALLTSSDFDRIQIFIDEFCLRVLIPYCERQIRFLSDVVANRSKSKSLLSATRRWLGSSKQPSGNINTVIYSQEASELQTRRLGDLCFMFGLYDMAYNAYYTAKNDFKSDQAWLYFAGAQEMAALSSFMLNPFDYPKRYLDGSLQTYLNVCKVYNFAIRLTLLSTEVLKHNNDYGEAAMMFIKMTSEESDLLSALMLEQAAHCFINSKKPLYRKYAFHMILSGHRYSKAGLRAHSYRAYKQAIQVYIGHEWKLAEDHIHYSMGKQAYHLNDTLNSKIATTKLIRVSHDDSGCNQISKLQQTTYLREFLNITEKLINEEKLTDLPTFPIPILDSENIKVLLGDGVETEVEEGWQLASNVSFYDDESLEMDWLSLEERMVSRVKQPQMIFRPQLQKLTRNTPNSYMPSSPEKEKIVVRVSLKNPLLIDLNVCNIRPIFNFLNENEEELSKEHVHLLMEDVPEVLIAPNSSEVITLQLRPQVLGELEIYGISFQIRFASNCDDHESPGNLSKMSVRGKREFRIIGPRLNSSMAEKTNVIYAEDNRLRIKVIPAMPKLSVAFNRVPESMFCGQMTKVNVRLCNVGPVPLKGVRVYSSNPEMLWFRTEDRRQLQNSQCLIDTSMNSGESLELPLFIHAQLESGNLRLKLLFIYEPFKYSLEKRYRIVRHLISIRLYQSLALELTCLKFFRILKDAKCDIPSYSTNMVIKLRNILPIEKCKGNIKILSIDAHSLSWKLLPYIYEDVRDIETGENCHLNLRCFNVEDKSGLDDIIHSSAIFTTDDMVLPPGLQDFAMCENLMTLNSKTPQSPPNKRTSNPSTSLCTLSLMNIAISLLWATGDGSESIYGSHNIFLKKIGDVINIPESEASSAVESEKAPVEIIPGVQTDDVAESSVDDGNVIAELENLVKVTLDYPTCFAHNFQKMPVCKISYSIRLCNACKQCLDIVLDLSVFPSTTPPQILSPQPSTNLMSVGGCVRRRTLAPEEKTYIKCVALASAPGTYCLGSFTLKAKYSHSNTWIEQSFPLQTGVVIRNITDISSAYSQSW